MTLYYAGLRPGVTSFSVDGIEHTVNPDTGYLEVEVMTPNLARELAALNATLVDPKQNPADPPLLAQAAQLTPAEEAERQELFTELDALTGRRVDRRRSLQQLRDIKSKLPPKG